MYWCKQISFACGPNFLSIPRTLYIYIYIRLITDLHSTPWLNSLLEVLQFLKESLSKPAPVPFAQSAQYKKNMTRDEGDQNEDEDERPAQARTQRKPKKKNKKSKKGPAQICKAAKQPVAASETEEYSPHRYTLLRKNFIDTLKNDGVSFKSAVEDWNNSKLKRQLLCNVPLNELKRRRFVPKEYQKNPWSDA